MSIIYSVFKGMKMFYFAYGSNLNQTQMTKRCPGSRPLYFAELEDMKFVINARGVATVVPEKGGNVKGIIWEISKSNEIALDLYEGVSQNLYKKEVMSCVSNGRAVDALVYVANEQKLGAPRANYLETILDGIEEFSDDKDWFKEVASWG